MRSWPRNSGFTLVEMIVVLVVLGVLSLGGTYFLANSVDGYGSVVDRQQLAERGRFALEHMTRGVQNALPGSVRVRNDCLEIVPVVTGAQYLSIPVAYVANSVLTTPPPVMVPPNGLRLAVAADDALYGLTNPGAISPTTVAMSENSSGVQTIMLNSGHQFISESTRNRLYWIATPISYCISGGHLWRYQDYGFVSVQPQPIDLPTTMPGRALLAETASVVFTLDAASLQNSSVVDVALVVSQGASQLEVVTKIQVRNVL